MENLKYCLLNNLDGVYYVEEGDTLDSIAKKFTTSKRLIIIDNNLTSDIEVGDALYVKRYNKVYVVGVVDTPESVANNLGITVEETYKINKTNYVFPFMEVVSSKD